MELWSCIVVELYICGVVALWTRGVVYVLSCVVCSYGDVELCSC